MNTLNSQTFSHIAAKLHSAVLFETYRHYKDFLNSKEVLFSMSKIRNFKIPAKSFRDYYILVEYMEQEYTDVVSAHDILVLLVKYGLFDGEKFEHRTLKPMFYFNSPFVKYFVRNNVVPLQKHGNKQLMYLVYEYLKQGKNVPVVWTLVDHGKCGELFWLIESGGGSLDYFQEYSHLWESEDSYVYAARDYRITHIEYVSYLIGFNNRQDLLKAFDHKYYKQYVKLGFLEANNFEEARKIEVPIQQFFITTENFNWNTYEFCREQKIFAVYYAPYLASGDILIKLIKNNLSLIPGVVGTYLKEDSLQKLLFLLDAIPDMSGLILGIISKKRELKYGAINAWMDYNKIRITIAETIY